MSSKTMDLYAPLQLPNGRWLYGAAAMNHRLYLAGGANAFAGELVAVGMRLGYQQAVRNRQKGGF